MNHVLKHPLSEQPARPTRSFLRRNGLRIHHNMAPLSDAFRDDRGQATVEYALVMLGAAAIAGMLLAWAVGSGQIGELMTTVVNSVLSDATPATP